MKGFIGFIRNHGVAGLAIGFIIGGAISKVVGSLTQDVINPIIGIILGKAGNLADLSTTIGGATITWGNFIVVLIDFIIIAAVVYFIFKGLGIEKLDKKANEPVT